jgi:hypothetical protein
MPISSWRRLRASLAASAVLTSLSLAACSDSFSPRRVLSSAGANRTRSGESGNAAKHGAIDVRLVRDNDQRATLVVRTGAFEVATGIGTPQGVLQTVHYTLYDASHKVIQTRNVRFDAPQPSTFSAPVDAGDGWSVSVQASLGGVDGDGTSTDVVRADAQATLLPDIAAGTLLLRRSTGELATIASSATVSADQPVTLAVPLTNVGRDVATPSTLGEQVACVVTIDNSVPSDLTFATSGGIVTVAPESSALCEFTTRFASGAHVIRVVAQPLTWPDLDPSNNVATANLTAAAGVFVARELTFGGGGVYQPTQLSPAALFGAPLPAGATYTFSAGDPTIAQVDATGLVIPRGDGSTTITVTVTVPGGSTTTILVPVTVSLPSPAVCQVQTPPRLLPHGLNIFVAGEPARTLSVQGLAAGAEVGWAVGNEAATVGGGAHVVRLETTATSAMVTPIAAGAATLTFTEIVNSTQVAAGTGCLIVISGAETIPSPAKLTLPSTATLTIQADGSTSPLQLTPALTDGAGANVTLTASDVAWSSGAPSVVGVSDDGTITAFSGSATPVTITARFGTLSASTSVTVVDLRMPAPPPAAFTVTPASPSCRVGDQVMLTANVPTGTTVSWTISSSLAFADDPLASSEVRPSVTLVCVGPAKIDGTPATVNVIANLNSQNTRQDVTIIMKP